MSESDSYVKRRRRTTGAIQLARCEFKAKEVSAHKFHVLSKGKFKVTGRRENLARSQQMRLYRVASGRNTVRESDLLTPIEKPRPRVPLTLEYKYPTGNLRDSGTLEI